MFHINEKTARYIQKHSGSVVIELSLEPAMGGCACGGKQVTGSYVPKITLGYPQSGAQQRFVSWQQEEITVFYPENLRIKEGYQVIEIKLRGLLGCNWLDLEGAKGISVVK